MKINRMIPFGKITIVSTMLTLLVTLNFSCKKEMIEDDPPKDCLYIFEEGLDDIYGAWEPKAVIVYDTGDSTYYEIGEGHTGHIFTIWYADAFELRDNKEINIYYTTSGRPCKDGTNGTWNYENMTLNVELGNDTRSIKVLSLNKDELIIEDIINAKESKAIMRKVN